MVIKERREQRSLTQKELADKSGVSESYLSLIESGKRRPSPEAAKRIAAVLGFDWVKFFEAEG